ncbi:transcription repressor NadR [Thalassorhabdus alkalitolerans]|uniref:Transcription repressor NadR n=1 Tax=Thalassorhabdus alkalitolerans TaxID=2282697 RepID=A0ABW0YR78_9BACI
MKEKLIGEDRRKLLLEWLKTAHEPITGSVLAKKTNVSRQVIVQDISILKARNTPILSTSQGYLLISSSRPNVFRKKIACCHSADKNVTQEELQIIVDQGATVLDVSVEHQLYGDITASLMIASRRDVHEFIKKFTETKATLLSELTGGVHLHTIEAPEEKILIETEKSLKEAGFLL